VRLDHLLSREPDLPKLMKLPGGRIPGRGSSLSDCTQHSKEGVEFSVTFQGLKVRGDGPVAQVVRALC
jgi:hypothetical protein